MFKLSGRKINKKNLKRVLSVSQTDFMMEQVKKVLTRSDQGLILMVRG